MAGGRHGNRDRGARHPPPATPAALERAAADYIARFAASTARLRRVLRRRVDRAAAAVGEDPAEGHAAIEALLVRLTGEGLLDDERYATGRAEALHRRGTALAAIRLRLRADGVAEETIDTALAAVAACAGDGADPDLAAAVKLARRRRLGPFRPPDDRQRHRDRDLRALARAGFDPDVVRTVVEAPSAEALERTVDPTG